jgi:heat shock protein HslJ
MLTQMKRLLALLILGGVLSGCGGLGGASATPTGGLEGTSWTLVNIGDAEVSADAAPTLAFDDALSVSGFAGCNQYTGAATIEGSSISMGPLATTHMACPGAPGIAETAFLAAMNEVQSFAIDSQGRLVLEDGVVLVFAPAEDAPAS